MFVRWLSVRALAVLALTCSLLVLQPATSPAYASVTVRGTYQELAAVSRSGEQQLHAVRTGHGTYWLDLGTLQAPRAGATIEVTGQRTSARSIAATSLKVVAEARTAPAAAPRANRLLVMRVYWGAAAPAKPTTEQARSIWLSRGNAWFKEVSHARYSISGTVTHWLKISNPGGCFAGAFTAMDRAKARASALGYRPAGYSRFILYLPCDASGVLGLGSTPGTDVWQFGSLDYKIAIHEQGHNLGLLHANTRTCTRGGVQVTWSGSCSVEEYADRFDVMGNRGDGHYQALYEKRLGWLQAMSRLTATGTRTLKPYETTGPGLKAIEVRVSATRSYWLEYRTKSGIDARFPAGSFGVQIRVHSGAAGTEPQLLDAMPGSQGFEGSTFLPEWDRVRLLPGSSWTSPEGVRISTLSQTASAARVAVKFHAGPAGAPSPPSSATATAIGDGAKVSWTRPADNGSIITGYVVTASPGGATEPVGTVGGLVTTTTFAGLDPATRYTFGVRALNIVGSSQARTSNAVTPTSTLPSVTITAPAAGSVLSGATTVTASPSPSPGTGSPISFVEFSANGSFIGVAFAAPWNIDWDPTGTFPDGPVTLTAVATDEAGAQAASPGISVTVRNPALTITAPSAGTVLSGSSTVSYQLFPPGLALDRAEAIVFDPATGFGDIVGTSIGANGSLQIDVSLMADTPDATLRVNAFDDAAGTSVFAEIPVAIANPL